MIVLLHCTTFRAVLNVALSSPKGYQISLRLPWVSSLSPDVEPGYRRMVGAVLLVTVHAKRVMTVSTGLQIVSRPLVKNHRHIYIEKQREGRGLKHRNHPPTSRVPSCRYSWGEHASAACGIPTASERGAESEAAHKWARWLYNPCHLGGPHRFKAGNLNKKKSRPLTTALANAQTGSHQPRSDLRPGQGQNPFLCFSVIFEFSTKF